MVSVRGSRGLSRVRTSGETGTVCLTPILKARSAIFRTLAGDSIGLCDSFRRPVARRAPSVSLSARAKTRVHGGLQFRSQPTCRRFLQARCRGIRQNWVWVSYGGCVTPPTVRCHKTVVHDPLGTSDCAYGVVADPYYGAITVATCDLEEVRVRRGGYLRQLGAALRLLRLSGSLSASCGCHLLLASGKAETLRELTVSNGAGGGVLTWSIAESAPWLTTNPGSVNWVSLELTFRSIGTGLPIGVYSSDLIVTSNGGRLCRCTFRWKWCRPSLYPRQSLTSSMNTTELILHVESTGPEPIPWTVDCNRSWLTASPDPVGRRSGCSRA